MNHQKTLAIACTSGAISVILGAFAAHALKEKLSVELLQVFETGVRYQFIHTLVLLIIGVMMIQHITNKSIETAVTLFTVGIVFFSGSLYMLAIRDLIGFSSFKWLGPITPIGGLCFILGWLFLLIGFLKYGNNEKR